MPNSIGYPSSVLCTTKAGATSSPPPLAGEGQGGGGQYDRAFLPTPSPPLPPLAGEGADRACRSRPVQIPEVHSDCSELHPDAAVERIGSSAAQRDGEADEAPQQRVLVAAVE